MRASRSKQPLAGKAAWWLTAFIVIAIALSLAVSGGSLIGAWSAAPRDQLAQPFEE